MSATDELYRSYLDLRWHLDPAAASAAGVTSQDDRLGDFSAEAIRLHLAGYRSIATAVEQLPVEEPAEEIERTAFLDEVRITIARFEHERPHVHDPSFWLGHLFNGFQTLLRRRFGTPAQRARSLLGRMDALPRFLESARGTLREPPRIFLETAQEMADAGARLLLDVAARIESDAPELAGSLETSRAEAEMALARFSVALRGELAAHHDDLSFAIGEDQFNRRLHHEHALQAGAPELYRYGLRLVAEVSAEVGELARRIDPTVPWLTLVERLRSQAPLDRDPVTACRAAVDRARGFLQARDLVTLPEGVLEVTETPLFLRPLLPFAAYEPPGPYAPDRTGVFYVTPPPPGDGGGRATHGRFETAITAVHEVWPGHHLHLLTAMQQTSEIRRVLLTPITVEGWALYCEELMAEQGFFESLEERLFQRVHLLWRALRIVLDVGLHTRGMTPDEARDQLMDRLGLDRTGASAEVSRYCAWPTYQLCYAVGRREVLQLRQAWRAQAGAGAGLREFHDAFLAWGGLPVSLIRWGMGLGIEP
jgi:uncharacterized protein (DUF885 family)